MEPIRIIIYGETASSKNSRDIVTIRIKGTDRTRPLLIKSKKARAYEAEVERQVRALPALLLGPLSFSAAIYYCDNRSDLDEALILDCLQGLIYKNDRQIVERHVWKRFDAANPRAVIEIAPVQMDMLAQEAA